MVVDGSHGYSKTGHPTLTLNISRVFYKSFSPVHKIHRPTTPLTPSVVNSESLIATIITILLVIAIIIVACNRKIRL